MTDATVTAQATVNFGPHEWMTVVGEQAFWSIYIPSAKAEGWTSGLTTELAEFDDKVALVVTDAVHRIAGAEEHWKAELRFMGRQAASPRPNGISLAYLFSKDDVAQNGLPTIEDIKAAFQVDACAILKKSYAAQGHTGDWSSRSFHLGAACLPDEWRAFMDHLRAPQPKPTVRGLRPAKKKPGRSD